MRLSLLAQILDLLCPRHCLICGQRLLGEEEIICIACNLHLPRTNTWQQPEDNDMAKLFWHSIPVEKCCALFHYHGHAPASNLLYQLKYNQHEEVGVGMGHLLANEALRIQFFDGIDAIVPIPLAPKRKRERGYNQSEAIARGLYEATKIPILNKLVRRKTFVESQTHKNRWERNINVQDVFALSPDYAPGGSKAESLEHKHLLIVDDVCTTGATIISCCRELMKATDSMKFSILTIGYAKGGSRPAGGLHLFRRQEGSRAHQHSGDFPGNAGNGFRGGGRSERDFHAGAAVVQQRFGKGYGLVRVMDDDDGDKPDGG